MSFSHLDQYIFDSIGINQFEKAGNKSVVNIFIIVMLVLALTAIINFINYSTAAATIRYKEIGIRKVVGSSKNQLRNQFLVESILVATLSMITALIIVYASLSYFNSIFNEQLSLNLLTEPKIYFSLLLVTLIVGLLAGIYPAFFSFFI